MAKRFSFVTRLQLTDGRKQFVRAVENGEKAETMHPVSRRYALAKLPKGYEWTIGERVVLVAYTAAGAVPTAIYGSFAGLTKGNDGKKAAIIEWDEKQSSISDIVAMQRIRPISCIPK